ncbi:helix-turn-helix transcriptional regulator [Hyphococcus luteus]|uniref:Transcriptional regulator n=1 Tax=Hyphococcus luteus TaxID=2058213 RepID=A0A2S7K6I8_9PROT|nr:helix-turn-helix transcriptional regulator [Marinicaulis flavus]PQA88134.1 transcriptional regulator [Marinicaulis flavus]
MGKTPISNRIRVLRAEHGDMSQGDLAARIGMTRQTVAAIEKGKYAPTLEAAFRIAAAFGVPFSEVFQYRADEDAAFLKRQKQTVKTDG